MTGPWRFLVGAVVAPSSTIRESRSVSNPALTAAVLLSGIVVLGLLTLPRQLGLLRRALEPLGNPMRDAHHAALAPGLTRLIVVDRLVPPPTVLLAGLFVVMIAEPALALARSHRFEIRAVILLGLVPLLFQRVGEVAITYLAPVLAAPPAGVPVTLPQQFVTGPALFWGSGEAPTWVEALNTRVNLITLWSVSLWAIGLQQLDCRPFSIWHLALPSFCLGLAGAITWWAGPLVLSIVLGGS